jgi:hypothetical protein
MSRCLFLNEDCDHFVYTRSLEQLTPQGVDALIDSYANGTQVSDVVLNTNASRSAVPSRVKQTFWDGYDAKLGLDQPYFAGTQEGREIIDKVNRGFLRLNEQGIDPYGRWIARAKALGARAWISIRMNDFHNVNEVGHAMHTSFWREHPEFWRAPWREYEAPFDRALDYSHPEVVKHHLDYTRECVERYDLDGLEADWMRQPWCFRPGREEEGWAISEGVMREMRRMLDARGKQLGRRLPLLARVPSKPETALKMGFDVASWARAGLVDVVVPSPDFGTTEYEMPVRLWQQLLHGTGVALVPGIEITLNVFQFAPFRLHTAQTARGAAAALYAQGAERLYLFNWMDYPGDARKQEVQDVATHELGSPESLAGKPRRQVMTFPSPTPSGSPWPTPLPFRSGRYGWHPSGEFRVACGPAPLANQTAHVRLALRDAANPERTVIAWGRDIKVGGPVIPADLASQLIVRIDGHVCPFAGAIGEGPENDGPTHSFRVPAGALRRGDNVIEVSNPTETFVSIEWVEVQFGGKVA